MRLLLPCLGLVICSMTEASELARGATKAAGVPATPLRTLSATQAPIGDYFAWAGQALCDANGNSYFLVVPPIPPGKNQVEPRAVLRVSADGKRRFSFTPASIPELANAHQLRTLSFTLDPEGGVFLLVWAESGGRNGQYIVSFDHKGGYRSHFEVKWPGVHVEQFEVFGSGRFLLRGRRPNGFASQLAILSASGAELEDVVGWSEPSKPEESPSPASSGNLGFDQITRGGDGRIYVAGLDNREGGDVVYAFEASGDSKEAFTLRPIPKAAPRLLGWKAAGDRFAAAYRRDESTPESAPGEHRGSYWIAVYRNQTRGGAPEPTVYGPAPGAPICYRHEDSGNRFTFLRDGKLVTMSAP